MSSRSRRSTRTAVGAQPASSHPVLPDDVLVKVLRAAKPAGVLTALASSSRRLCTLARSRVGVKLSIITKEQAALVIASQAHGRPAFSACTQLYVKAADLTSCLLAGGVLYAAKQWTALRNLQLYFFVPAAEQRQQQPGVSVECLTSNALCCLPALQQLQRLEIDAPGFGACSAERVAQLVQLTALKLCVGREPEGALPNLAALAQLTNLVHLRLQGACVTQPAAAAAEGPSHLPSSLTCLEISATGPPHAATVGCWATHLPGCPQLLELHIRYGKHQHASAHPSALVPLLAQHNQKLCVLDISYDTLFPRWSSAVAGLPDAEALVNLRWQPDAALAALTGLQVLTEQLLLCVRQPEDWHHLTALASLAGAKLYCVPQPQPAAALQLLELRTCTVYLDGRELGQLLLACPLLLQAEFSLCAHVATLAVQAGGPRLASHPSLRDLSLEYCNEWESAPAQFAALAPVLSGVRSLSLKDWRHGGRASGLPDVSACTAVTSLVFGCEDPDESAFVPLEQEAILSMVAPLVQLQSLVLFYAPRVSARVAVPLQYMLPQLQSLQLFNCGTLLPGDSSSGSDEEEDVEQQEQEAEALQQVMQLLRSDLDVSVDVIAK